MYLNKIKVKVEILIFETYLNNKIIQIIIIYYFIIMQVGKKCNIKLINVFSFLKDVFTLILRKD